MLQAVTGAFGYTGRHVARALLERGERVRTLTGRPWLPDPFAGQFPDRFEVTPGHFHDERALAQSLEGVDTLYNTVWIRFPSGGHTFERVIEDSGRLFRAARMAGVRRVVHVSVSQPHERSPLPYFAGKARAERLLAESRISFSIVRPTLIFGPGPEEALLLNNIAWFLRRFPVFGLPGDGRYPVQPVDMRDVVDLCLAGAVGPDGITVDAAGPDRISFRDLVVRIRDAVGGPARLLSMPPAVVASACGILSPFLRDTILTRDEIDGLIEGRLVGEAPRACRRRFETWLESVAGTIGRCYVSDRRLHMERRPPPPPLANAPGHTTAEPIR